MVGHIKLSSRAVRGARDSKIEQPAATAWFHPHLHHDTARQVYMGLTGLIIVDDGSDASLSLPRTYGTDDLPIIIQDRSFDADGALLYDRDPDPQTIQYGAPRRYHHCQWRGSPRRSGPVQFGAAANSQCSERTKFRPAVQRPTRVSRHRVRRRISFSSSLDEAAQGFSRGAFRNPCRLR